MDGIGSGLGEQGWYAPSGGNGPVAEMDGHANGWAGMGDQIAVGPMSGEHQWPIGAVPQGDYGPVAVGDHPGGSILSTVEGWDRTYMDPRRNFGGDGGLG